MTSKKTGKKSVTSSESRKRPDGIIYPPAEETWVWVESEVKIVNGKYVESVKVHPPGANILMS